MLLSHERCSCHHAHAKCDRSKTSWPSSKTFWPNATWQAVIELITLIASRQPRALPYSS